VSFVIDTSGALPTSNSGSSNLSPHAATSSSLTTTNSSPSNPTHTDATSSSSGGMSSSGAVAGVSIGSFVAAVLTLIIGWKNASYAKKAYLWLVEPRRGQESGIYLNNYELR
jgi:hypothetical protein